MNSKVLFLFAVVTIIGVSCQNVPSTKPPYSTTSTKKSTTRLAGSTSKARQGVTSTTKAGQRSVTTTKAGQRSVTTTKAGQGAASTSKARQGVTTTTKKAGLLTQTTKQSGLVTQATKPSGLVTKSTAKPGLLVQTSKKPGLVPPSKRSTSERPNRVGAQFAYPTAAPVITCENVTGVSKFKFADFASGVWYLHQEFCAMTFNPWFGFCSKGTFTVGKDKESSSLETNSLLDGIYVKPPVSTLTTTVKSGIMNWTISSVGIRTEIMPAKSSLSFVVVGTDYKNWAAAYVCGKLCVQLSAASTTAKPTPPPSAECTPGDSTCYMIFLRNRTYTDEKARDAYLKEATESLKVQFPYVITMAVEQSSTACKN